MSEVRTGKSVEYLQPLEELQVNMKNRMEVGTVLRELRLENIRCKHDAEIIANEQNFQVRGIELTEEDHLKINNHHLLGSL